MESVYTFRDFWGVVKYDIIECSEDQKNSYCQRYNLF